jgi:hypothetical protein
MKKSQLGRTGSALALVRSAPLAALLAVAITQTAVGDMTTIPAGDVVVTINGVNSETQQGRTARFEVDVQTDGSFALTDGSSQGDLWSLTDLDVSGNVDPFTNVVWSVTNNTAVPQVFTVSVTLPISPQTPSTVHGGSFGGTLNDANFNGSASVSTAGGLPLYRGQIDGATVLSIYPDPYTQSVAFAGQTIAVPAMNPGLPGPTIPSGPATSTIGIINHFLLSPGDTFSGNSFFVIEAVPEPSTLGLAAAALTATLIVRRRR